MQRSTRVLCAAFVLLAILRPAVGEVFLLRSGGRIEGDLVNADEKPRTSYVISLPSGGQITLDAAAVEKVQPVPPGVGRVPKGPAAISRYGPGPIANGRLVPRP